MEKRMIFSILGLMLVLSMMAFASASVNLKNGLVAYYPLQDGNLTDLQNGQNATPLGGCSLVVQSGKVGNAVNTTTCSIDTPVLFSFSDLSISLWTYLDSNSGSQVFIQSDTGGYGFDEGFAGTPEIYYNTGGTQLTSNYTIPTNQWIYLTITLNSTESDLYANGELKYIGTGGNSGGGGNVAIGSHRANFNKVQGLMDEVGFWNRTLTPEEISALYQEGDGLDYANFDNPFAEPINFSVEHISPDDNSMQTSPVTFEAQLFVNNTSLANSTLLVYNSTDLVISDFKNESGNVSKTETWVETLDLGNYTWNVNFCVVNGGCVMDEENGSFSVIPTPPTPIVPDFPRQIQGSGQIYEASKSAGAGLAVFLHYMFLALPFLLIGLGIVGVILVIGFAFAHVIKASIGKK